MPTDGRISRRNWLTKAAFSPAGQLANGGILRVRFAVAAFVLIGFAGVVAGTALAQQKNSDDRQAVVVSEVTRSFILGEMRSMLAAAQGVAEAIGKRDWPAAATAAERSGLKAFQAMPKQTMMELPEEFRAFGRQTHMSFDAVADAAKVNSDPTIVSAN